MRSIEVNGRSYRLPRSPAVVVCVDGCEPDYIAQAVAGGHMPWMQRTLANGSAVIADCVVPSFTNPNNLSIVTGVPPAVHGICGNFLYDVESGTEVMMNDPKWLRAPTLLAALSRCRLQGRRGHRQGQAAHAPRPQDARHLLLGGEGRRGDERRARHRRSARARRPAAALRLQRRALGVRVRRGRQADGDALRPDVMYLSTTDYVQHKHAPGSPEANAFYRMMDRYLAELERAGLRHRPHRRSRHERQDSGSMPARTSSTCRTCSMAGSARAARASSCRSPTPTSCTMARSAPTRPSTCRPASRSRDLAARIAALRGIEVVLDARRSAARRFELPADRIGDLVVVSERARWPSGPRRGEARPLRPRCAAALARRPLRAAGAADHEPPRSPTSTPTGAGATSMPSTGC